MKTPTYLVVAFTVLSACGNTPAIVSDFNGDSVKIVTYGLETVEYQRSVADPEAARICATQKKRAEYASVRVNTQTYENEHLYLCL